MNKEEALEFLRLHQPMPSEFDDDLDSEAKMYRFLRTERLLS